MNKEKKFNEIFYNPNLEKLLSYAMRLSNNNKQEAEYLLQETWLKVWRHMDKFDAGKAKPITWIRKIMQNTFITLYRFKEKLRTEEFDPNFINEINYNDAFVSLNEFTELFNNYNSEDNTAACQTLFNLYALKNEIPGHYIKRVKNKKLYNEDFFTLNPLHHRHILYRIHLMKN